MQALWRDGLSPHAAFWQAKRFRREAGALPSERSGWVLTGL